MKVVADLKTAVAFTMGAVAAVAGALVLSASGAGANVEPGQIDTTYVPISPCRLFDLRPEFTVGDRTSALGPGEVYTQQVTGAVGDCDVPEDATAVMMNVTFVSPTAASYLTVYPADLAEVPRASSLNWFAGQVPTPNAVDAKLSPDGKLKFFNLDGHVYVLADVVGYHTATSLQTLTAQIAQRTIPSGETVTGNFVYRAQVINDPYFSDFVDIDLPGAAPAALDSNHVNFSKNSGRMDADAACVGTPENPTAPPGKVCLYPSIMSGTGTYDEIEGSATSGPLKTQGFGINILVDGAADGSTVTLVGSWAYTAP